MSTSEKFYRCLLPFLCAILFFQFRTFAQQQFPLDELKTLAEKRYEAVRISQLNTEQAKLNEEIASATRFPKIDLNAAYTHISETGGIDIQLPGFERRITFGDGNIYETGITASVPVFTGFRISTAIEIQKENQKAAGTTLEGSITDIRNQVTMQYRLAQLAKKNIAVYAEQSKLVFENLAARKEFLRYGQALAYDTLLLSIRLNQVQVEQASAENKYRRALLILMQFTGMTTAIDVLDEFPMQSELENLSAEELLNIALQDRSDMRNLRSAKTIHKLALRSAQSAYYPSVYAMASYKYGRPGIDQVRNEWMDYYTAGVRFEWNLWSWGVDRKAVEKQELEVKKTELLDSQLLSGIKTQITIILNDLDVKRKMIQLLEEQVKQEKIKLDLIQARFREGLATSMEIVDAETSLTTARLRFEQTKIEYSLKLTELAAAVGKEF